MQEKNRDKKGVLFERLMLGGAVVFGIAIIVLAIVFGKSSESLPSQVSTPSDGRTGLEITNQEPLGDPRASSTIVEFLDFQCSACVMFFQQMDPQIRAKYIDTGKAKMFAKTLSFIDGTKARGESFGAARAAQCAIAQDSFWKMHDLIFGAEASEVSAGKGNENTGNLTRDVFMGFARTIGMDESQFTSCYDSDQFINTTSADLQDAGVALQNQVATPSVFVNGVKIKNPFDLKEYEALIMGKY